MKDYKKAIGLMVRADERTNEIVISEIGKYDGEEDISQQITINSEEAELLIKWLKEAINSEAQ